MYVCVSVCECMYVRERVSECKLHLKQFIELCLGQQHPSLLSRGLIPRVASGKIDERSHQHLHTSWRHLHNMQIAVEQQPMRMQVAS